MGKTESRGQKEKLGGKVREGGSRKRDWEGKNEETEIETGRERERGQKEKE